MRGFFGAHRAPLQLLNGLLAGWRQLSFTLVEESSDDTEERPHDDKSGGDDEVGADHVWFLSSLGSRMGRVGSRVCGPWMPRIETRSFPPAVGADALAFMRTGKWCHKQPAASPVLAEDEPLLSNDPAAPGRSRAPKTMNRLCAESGQLHRRYSR